MRISAAAYRRSVKVMSAAAVVAQLACGGVLDVDNPNNVVDESLNNPAATASIVNGAGASVIRMLNALAAPMGAVTDELTWSGSRDGFKQLDDGGVSDPANEYVDAATFSVSEARYLSEEAITRLLSFEKANTLKDANELARAYLYAAVAQTTIGDHYDDFVLKSFRTEAAANEGESKIVVVYDNAIDMTTKGLAKATNNDLRRNLTAMRARARFGKAVWQKLNPGGTTPTQPLVSDAAAATDAKAALALGTGDWRLDFTPNPTGGQGSPGSGFEINVRFELAGGDVFFYRNTAGTKVDSVRLRDPVANVKDPALTKNLDRCCRITPANGDGRYIPITAASAREMHLIVAEEALARNSTAEFTAAINALRVLDALPPYAGTPAALDMLKHSRAVNLFMQGRRLADLYRFGLRADRWQAGSHAVKRVGCFFSIPITERQANPLVQDQPTCQ